MKNLISMVDFVLDVPVLGMEAQSINMQGSNRYQKCINYANFLKQPLELWMFVPCDEDGYVLDKKFIWADTDKDYIFESAKFDKYQQAKEKCLFDGIFSISKKKDYYIVYLDESAIYVSWNKSKIIEDLVAYDLQLTPTAIKQLQS